MVKMWLVYLGFPGVLDIDIQLHLEDENFHVYFIDNCDDFTFNTFRYIVLIELSQHSSKYN